MRARNLEALGKRIKNFTTRVGKFFEECKQKIQDALIF